MRVRADRYCKRTEELGEVGCGGGTSKIGTSFGRERQENEESVYVQILAAVAACADRKPWAAP